MMKHNIEAGIVAFFTLKNGSHILGKIYNDSFDITLPILKIELYDLEFNKKYNKMYYWAEQRNPIHNIIDIIDVSKIDYLE